MTLAFLFWLLMLLWLILGGVIAHRSGWKSAAPELLQFAVICILGWAVFGSPIK